MEPASSPNLINFLENLTSDGLRARLDVLERETRTVRALLRAVKVHERYQARQRPAPKKREVPHGS